MGRCFYVTTVAAEDPAFGLPHAGTRLLSFLHALHVGPCNNSDDVESTKLYQSGAAAMHETCVMVALEVSSKVASKRPDGVMQMQIKDIRHSNKKSESTAGFSSVL